MDPIRFFYMRIIILPAIRRDTSPTPISCGFLFKGIILHAINASKDVVPFGIGVISSIHSLFIISAFCRSIVSAPKAFEHIMRLHPSGSIPECPEPHFIEDPIFNTRSSSIAFLNNEMNSSSCRTFQH